MTALDLRLGVRMGALALAALTWACNDDLDLDPAAPAVAEAPAMAASHAAPVTPSPLATVAFGGSSLQFWSYIGADLSGTPSDPVNLLFPGSDARRIRAAMVLLNGDRSAYGFPNAAPFDCTWKEAIGANQATWVDGIGWTPSAIQLECGDFGPIRFHVRLFPGGAWTLANAHFEVLIPGTNRHEILSWELAEQLVTVDFIRSGLLDPGQPLGSSGTINAAPSYRTIQPVVFNGLPAALKVLLTGSPSNVATPVPVATNGMATIVNIAGSPGGEATVAMRDYDLMFNQIIPKPFCASGPFDWIRVQGPIRFRQRVVLTPSGNFVSHFQGTGSLDLTPVNPLTSPPTVVGETYRAQVVEHHRNVVTDQVTLVANVGMQVLIPPSGPFRGSLHSTLRLGPGGADASELTVRCGS